MRCNMNLWDLPLPLTFLLFFLIDTLEVDCCCEYLKKKKSSLPDNLVVL